MGAGSVSKKFFGNIGSHSLKIRAPPGPLPWIHHCFFNDKRIVFGPISILDFIGAVLKQGLFHKGPLGEIARVELFLWDLITFMFAVTRRSNSNCPWEEKLEPGFTVKGVVNSEKWLNRETFSIILELILNTRSVFIY